MAGGVGNDSLSFTSHTTGSYVEGGEGKDTINFSGGVRRTTTVLGGAEADYITGSGVGSAALFSVKPALTPSTSQVLQLHRPSIDGGDADSIEFGAGGLSNSLVGEAGNDTIAFTVASTHTS